MMEQDVCPLCAQQLQLKQINLEEAVLLCPELKCPYPFNDEYVVISSRSRSILRNKQSKTTTHNSDQITAMQFFDTNGPSSVMNPDLIDFDTDSELNKLISELDMNSANVNFDNVELYDFTGSINGSNLMMKSFNSSSPDFNKVHDIDNNLIEEKQFNTDANLNNYAHGSSLVGNNSEKIGCKITIVSNFKIDIDTNIHPMRTVESSNSDTKSMVENKASENSANNYLKNTLPTIVHNTKIGDGLPAKSSDSIETLNLGNDETIVIENSTNHDAELAGSIVNEIIMSFDEDDDGEEIIFD